MLAMKNSQCLVVSLWAVAIAQNFGDRKLWWISAHSIFGGENIGGLVIFSVLEIDQVYVLLEYFSKTPYLFRFVFNIV